MSTFWEWEEDRVCRDMAEQGYSASRIAPSVGKSRCAVVGYCRRHGITLKGRYFPVQRSSAKRVQKAQEASHPCALPPPVPILQKPIPAHSLLTAGPYECRFVIGEPVALTVCGEAIRNGSSYCGRHHDVCWIKR